MVTAKQAEELYNLMLNSCGSFAEIICDEVLTDNIPEFHREIYNTIQTQDRVVIAAPRGFAKSTLISKIFPLWKALFRKSKDICIISASEGLATEHLRYIKHELENNPKINGFWGDLKSEKWSETHIILQFEDGHRINIRAKGAGGQIRGFRPDCIVCDDLETDDSVESEEQRKKLKNWLHKACINTLLPGGQLLIIGTLIHPLSVLADLLDTPNGWYKKKYTAYLDGIEDEGHELWPQARNHKWLQERKAEIGSWAFAAEFMNDPRSDGAAPIKPDQIKYWTELPTQLSMVITMDPAYKDDTTSDYKTSCLIGIDNKNNRYLIDMIHTRNPIGEYIEQTFNLWQRNKGNITAFGVPNQGLEIQFYDKVIQMSIEKNLGIPIVGLKNSFSSGNGIAIRNKTKRIVASLQPWFEKGTYYIHENHHDAKDELLSIGFSKHDDIVDCMSYAENILSPTFHEEEEDKEDHYIWGEEEPTGCYGIEY